MTKIKDTDYLYISARVRALERGLLTRERMERMLDARSDEEASKVLLECGYGEMSGQSEAELERIIADYRLAFFEEIYSVVPDRNLIDVFLIKYDYHNVKTLIKSEHSSNESEHLMIDSGRIRVRQLVEMIRQSDYRLMPKILRAAVAEARDILARTGDPQLADFSLDRAYFKDMQESAAAVGSLFLVGYVRAMIDATNLKSMVRAVRIERGPDFLRGVLIPGGNVDIARLISVAASGGSIEEVFSMAGLSEAAAAGSTAMRGEGSLTTFEKLCEDSITNYLKKARYVSFGEQPVIAYVAAREAEITSVRIIMTGRYAGLSPDAIRERLRDVYV